MTIINLAEYNTKCYGVTFKNNGCIKVQKFEDLSNGENIIYNVNPWKPFWVKANLAQ